MHPYFVGLDVHKQIVAFCIKTADGKIVKEGTVRANRSALAEWVKTVPGSWVGGMETTMFSHWIYYYLRDGGADILMGHAARMKAISAGKNKSDKLDARTIADLLRANLFPSCYVISPELGALRRQLRYRRLIVEQHVTFRNKTAGLLMEYGVEYERKRLHGKQYFQQLMKESDWISTEMRPLLKFNRDQIDRLQQMDKLLLTMLSKHPQLEKRIEALQKIDGVGPVTSLTWALEIGDPTRFPSIGDAQSYCGLTTAFRQSAGKEKRGPLSKQRNPHLQSVLVEAAKMAAMRNEKLKDLRAKAKASGDDDNTATLEVARKLVAYLMAADRAFLASQRDGVAAA